MNIIYSTILFYYNFITKEFLKWFFNNLNLGYLNIENIKIRMFILNNDNYFFLIFIFLLIIFSPFILIIWVSHHFYLAGIHIINDYIFNIDIKFCLKIVWFIICLYFFVMLFSYSLILFI